MTSKDKKSYPIPLFNLVVIVLSIFIVELVIMFLLRLVEVPPLTESLLDSILLIILSSPFLYFFLYRPLIFHVTERKRADEELRFYSEISINMSDGINLMRASDGVLLYTNQKFNEMFGYDDGELLGKNVSVLNANEDELSSELMIKNIVECLNKKGEWRGEVQNKKKDNSLFWTQASVVRFKHFKFGDCYLSIQYEITKSKQAEETLKKAKKDAEIANLAKSEFLANMSHEIRTPMTTILGMAELLSETKLGKEQLGYVDHLMMSGDALVRIINDILDLSKVDAGMMDLEEINFSLSEKVEKIFSVFSAKADEKGINLKSNISPDVPEYFFGDPIRLRQVLINLVGNALKFTESGEVAMSFECGKSCDDIKKCNLLISVIDTGIGIPEHKLETIFETFTQGDSTMTRIYGGTGLGLSISKKLVRLMGGTLQVESNEGEGSRFYFTLPMKIGSKEEGIFKGQDAYNVEYESEQPLKILLAEDAEDSRLLLKSFLKDTPHTLDMAENGEEAIEMFTANEYDLVLMDMQMPVMDGYTATRVIRGWEKKNERKAIPVIAFTAHALKEELEKCLEAGCTDHLAKPVKKKEIIKAIQSFSVSNS